MDLESRKQLPLLPMGTVQKLTGLTARQIRYYEHHGLVSPARSEGNQRLFSFNDAERLIQIRALLDESLTMSEVKMRMARLSRQAVDTRKPDLTDTEVYQRMRSEMLDSKAKAGSSEFQGDLFRFYRRH